MLFATEPPTRLVRNWMINGVCNRNPGGPDRIYLKCFRDGGFLFTTQEWVDEFKRACMPVKQLESQ